MAKLSLSPKDATKGGGFGAQEGWWQILKAYATVYQFPASADMKAKNEEYPPSTQVILELAKLNPQTKELLEDDGEPVFERLGFGGKNDLTKVRPGKMSGPDDADVEDLGDELGLEGNSVYCEDGTTLADNCAWIIFSKDLEAKGFKPDMIGSGWLPYLEGTKFEVVRHAAYKNPNKQYKSDPTNLGVKNIAVFGYEVKKGKSAPAKGKGAPAKSAPAAPAASPANGAADVTDETQAIALAAVKAIGAAQVGKPAMKRALFQAQIMTYLMKNSKLDMKGKNDLMNATVKDDGWLAEVAGGGEVAVIVDFAADGGKGTLEFPAE